MATNPIVTMIQARSAANRTVEQINKALESETLHKDNKYEDGRLTERGVTILRALFRAGLRDTEICDLMDITPSACSKRRAALKGGLTRSVNHLQKKLASGG